MLAIGDYLQNRYRVVRQLGHGGMGTVYEAHDERFENAVALKEVLIDLAKIADPMQQQMVARAFEREAKTLALLHHEAFPHVIDYFSERNHQYLIMELIKGEDLGEQLQARKRPFEFEEVLEWTKQLLDALDYLHTQEQPIIHRDLKPQNMKITNRGKVKVLDFGIAKGADNKSSSTITNQTFVAATLNYSPIEQLLRVLDPTFREFISQRHKEKVEDILEHNADARSDLYSLGATIYQLLTATQPHDTLKRALDLWAGKPDPLPNPMDLNPSIPPQFNAILLKSMEIDRDSRYVSAAEMLEAVKKFLQNPNQSVEQQKPQNAAPELGMKTQLRIAEAERFLAELESPSAKTEILSPAAHGSTPAQQFIPPVNPDEERRRIAEQQKFLADLDAPTKTEISNQAPPPQQGAFTDYGQSISPSNQQVDQTNYAINQAAAGDHTQVSHLANILPAKAADATVINPQIREQVAPQQQSVPAVTEEKSSNKMMMLVPVGIVGALLLVTVIGVVGYFVLRTPQTSETPGSNVKSGTTTTYTPSTDPSPAPSVAPSTTPLTADTTAEQSTNPSTASKPTTSNPSKPVEKPVTREEPQRQVPQQQQQQAQTTVVKPPPTPKPAKTPKPGKVTLDEIINR